MKQWIVLLSVAVYWGGVWLRAGALKKKIGHSPNVWPGNAKEAGLWAGWALVIAGWSLAGQAQAFEPPRAVFFDAAGYLAIAAGLAGTAWCHAAMGDAWRLGVRGEDKTPLITQGPYRRMRHPIYFFQAVILAGIFLLLPSWVSAGTFLLHQILVRIKTRDEELHLETLHGALYKEYAHRTGALWPKI